MSSSMKCRLKGHDLNECGVCSRCEAQVEAGHSWEDAPREKPCFRREVCARCGVAQEFPDHDWESFATPAGLTETGLKCTRCGLTI